jgi:hypothetical protein
MIGTQSLQVSNRKRAHRLSMLIAHSHNVFDYPL